MSESRTPIETFGLPWRCVNALLASGISSVEELDAASASDLLRVPNIGAKTINVINLHLARWRSRRVPTPAAEPLSHEARAMNASILLAGLVSRLDEVGGYDSKAHAEIAVDLLEALESELRRRAG